MGRRNGRIRRRGPPCKSTLRNHTHPRQRLAGLFERRPHIRRRRGPAAAAEVIPKGTYTAEAKAANNRADLPAIIVAPDEKRVTDEAIAAISKSDKIFQRGGACTGSQ